MHCAVNYQVCSFFKSSFGVIKSRGNNSLPNKKEITHYCPDFSLSCLYGKDIYENFCVDTNLLNIYVFFITCWRLFIIHLSCNIIIFN